MRILRKKSDERGFTLIEIMVASMVFAVGMLGVLKLLHTGIMANRYAKDLTNANAILQEHMEMISREAFIGVANGSMMGSVAFFDNATNGDATANDGIFTRQFIQNNKVFTCSLREELNTPRAKIDKITGTCTWTDMGGASTNTAQKSRTVTHITYKNGI